MTYAMGAFLALGLSYFFMRQRIRLVGYIAGRVEYLFGSAIFERILRISPTLSEGASVGAQMARLRSFESIRDFFTTPLASTLLELPVSIFFFLLLVWINPWAALVFMAAVAVYGLLYLTQFKSIARMTQHLLAASTERNRFMNEWVANMRQIRSVHGQTEWLNRFNKLSANATMLNFGIEKKTAGAVAASNFIMMTSALAVVAIATPMVIAQTLSSGALIASMLLIWRVLYPLQTIYINITRIERIRSAVNQINGLMKIEVEPRLSSAALSMRRMQGQLQFNRVGYRYAGSTESALAGLSLKVESGQLCCLIGTNGAGKSTLIKLLLRMLPLQNGAILMDGIDIRQYSPTELRRQLGYAPQEVQFFRATILQNLRLSRPDAPDSEIERILKQLAAWDDVLSLKDGLHTRLGDNTQLLGSALMQKLNLARAIVTDAPVLVLDEPTTHLDHVAIEALTETLRHLKGAKTILVLTQHEDLLKVADQMVQLENGSIKTNLLLSQPVVGQP
jgi:ATP-binding cassette subfamily C protein LapB